MLKDNKSPGLHKTFEMAPIRVRIGAIRLHDQQPRRPRRVRLRCPRESALRVRAINCRDSSTNAVSVPASASQFRPRTAGHCPPARRIPRIPWTWRWRANSIGCAGSWTGCGLRTSACRAAARVARRSRCRRRNRRIGRPRRGVSGYGGRPMAFGSPGRSGARYRTARWPRATLACVRRRSWCGRGGHDGGGPRRALGEA